MSCDDIFASIRSPNEETIERIVGAIKARLLSPGDRLPAERDLAAQLGVSRSTLRVALQNLVRAGWLEVRRGRSGGAFVARWPAMPHPRRLPEVLTRPRCSITRPIITGGSSTPSAPTTARRRAALRLITSWRRRM
jgi:DNA-binding transcriptional regulator YhcF (GntR family)